MSPTSNLFTSSNRSNASTQQEETTSCRVSSLFAAVRKHGARSGGGRLGLRRPDDALARHARGLYERP